jgi:hypothetical protein
MELDNHDADLGHASVAAPADAVPGDAHGHGQVGEVAQWQYWRGAHWLFYQDEWWLYYHGEWWRQALCWLRWQPDLVQWNHVPELIVHGHSIGKSHVQRIPRLWPCAQNSHGINASDQDCLQQLYSEIAMPSSNCISPWPQTTMICLSDCLSCRLNLTMKQL